MKYPTMRFYAADKDESGTSVSDPSTDTAAPGGDHVDTSVADANTTGADTSAAPDKKDEAPKLLDAVKDVLKPDATATSSTAKVESQPVAKVEQPKPGEVLDDAKQAEADKTLPFHNHPRFQQLTRERSAFKAEVEAFRPDAEEQRAIQAFMAQHDIPAKDVAESLNFLAAMRNDPVAARAMLDGIIKQLDEFTGTILPVDLQKKVDAGLVDEDTAREMAKLRATSAFKENRSKEIESKTTAQKEQEAAQVAAAAVYKTTSEWEKQQKATDPDYAEKAALIDTQVRAAMLSGAPKTPEAATKMLNDAKAAVDEHFKRFAPARKSSAPRLESGASVPAAAKVPTSMREAVAQALSS
jgi:hypothetical protein